MGQVKHLGEVMRLFEKSPVVDARSIARVIRSRTDASQYEKQLVHNLLKSGRIKRLAKGCYTARDDPSLAVFCFKPAYLGLQDALSFHELWEQETAPVILTARRVRQGARQIMGQNVLIRRLDRRYMFGFDYYNRGDLHLPYSDVEKTLIDMVYFGEHLTDEALRNLRKRLDTKKLRSYLKAYPAKTRASVLRAAELQD